MSTFTQQREAVFELAKHAVIGVAAARLCDNEHDAAFIISSYHRDAEKIGLPNSTAWALLFSAGEVAFTDALTAAAKEHHQSPAAELAEFALSQEHS